tara:strand:- start:468 stop:1076 length:609 start_codon:yes stop_codon:yes gene_type:complete
MSTFGLSDLYSGEEDIIRPCLNGKNIFRFVDNKSGMMVNYNGVLIDALMSWFTKEKVKGKLKIRQYFLREMNSGLEVYRYNCRSLDRRPGRICNVITIPDLFRKGNPIISTAYIRSKKNGYHDLFSIDLFSKIIFDLIGGFRKKENEKSMIKGLKNEINRNRCRIIDLEKKVNEGRDELFLDWIKTIVMLIVCYLIINYLYR